MSLMDSHVVLGGFMASGKSTVGKSLARRLGMPFVDVDAQIERQTSRSISSLLLDEAEATFRERERVACSHALDGPPSVIALGGGALEEPSTLDRVRAERSVWLKAPRSDCMRRIARGSDRPLAARAEELWEGRQGAYRRLPLAVHTGGRTVDEVAAAIVALLDVRAASPSARAIAVDSPDGGYTVWIGPGLLRRVPSILSFAGIAPGKCALASPSTLPQALRRTTLQALVASGFSPHDIQLPDGESHKTTATLVDMWHQLADAGLERGHPLLALGGGVVGDVTGMAAATYLRGVPFVTLPTTLLAMVDASVGGKTAVDLPHGKNLVGAFKHPRGVVADVDALGHLPERQWKAGMGEVIKHALLPGGEHLLAMLEGENCPDRTEMIAAAVAVKVPFIERDPQEAGDRALLNLGHTFAHAFERDQTFGVPHGLAVGVGLLAAAELSACSGLADPALPRRVEALLRRHGLPTRMPMTGVEAVVEAMAFDKKRAEGRLWFVLPVAEGQVVRTPEVELGDVRFALRAVRA